MIHNQKPFLSVMYSINIDYKLSINVIFYLYYIQTLFKAINAIFAFALHYLRIYGNRSQFLLLGIGTVLVSTNERPGKMETNQSQVWKLILCPSFQHLHS